MIRFSKHALIKLAHRKIGEKYVELTVEEPDYLEISGGRMIAFKKFKKLTLKVIYLDRDTSKLIVTQHWIKTK